MGLLAKPVRLLSDTLMGLSNKTALSATNLKNNLSSFCFMVPMNGNRKLYTLLSPGFVILAPGSVLKPMMA